MYHSDKPQSTLKASAVAASALLSLFVGFNATAQTFPSLKIESKRSYMLRFGYTYLQPTGRMSEVKDVTGPVLPYGTTVAGSPNALDWSSVGGAPFALQVLDGFGTSASGLGIPADHPNDPQNYALGTPSGVSGTAKGTGTPTISLLAFLEEDKKWAVEGYVLAVPPETHIYGAGRIGGNMTAYPGRTVTSGSSSIPNAGGAVDLGRISTTKVLPITASLHYFLGDKTAKFRPSVGVAATYAAFFDTRASQSLENYAGGKTSIDIKNAFGIGPVFGFTLALNERWSINGTLTYIKLKTTAKMTTQTDPYVLGNSAVQTQSALDIGPNTLDAIVIGQNTTVNGTSGTVDALKKLALLRTGDERNLGSYTRKMDAKLDPVVFALSVGYAF